MSDRLIYGLNPVREAMRAGRRIRTIYVHRTASKPTTTLLDQARALGVRVVEATRSELSTRAGVENHQGIVAEVETGREERAPTVQDLIERARAAHDPPLILLLDSVQDPQNLGALIRTAHAFGAHGVVIPKDRAASVTASVVKASAGATEHIPVVRVTNLRHAVDELADAGVWSAAATLTGDPLDGARLDGPLALVVGAEAKGVREKLAERCDMRVRIEMPGGFDSLNVTVAAGILLYEAVRQRRAGLVQKRDP